MFDCRRSFDCNGNGLGRNREYSSIRRDACFD